MSPERKDILKTILTAFAVGVIGFLVFMYLLHPFFSGSVVLPQNIKFLGFKIQFYGLIIGLAALSGYWLSQKRRSIYNITQDDAEYIFFLVLVCGFIGARLYHVLSQLPYYLEHPLQSFAVWHGGLSIFGAGIGGVIALLVYVKVWKKYSLWQLLDWLTPGVVLGQIIGRFGNFINYELYGTPTNLPWKMYVPPLFRLPTYEIYQYFHPLFLYEAAGSAIILVLLLRLKFKPGRLFLLWLFLYNVMRLFLENLRADSVIYGGIRINAIVALLLATVAVIIYVKSSPHHN